VPANEKEYEPLADLLTGTLPEVVGESRSARVGERRIP
jgi:hypothetical protein